MKSLESWDNLDLTIAEANMPQQGETIVNSAEDLSTEDMVALAEKELNAQPAPKAEDKKIIEAEAVQEELDPLELLKQFEVEATKEALKVKTKVNGKDEIVTLDELKKNYSGKTHWDKKFSELDKERKAFQKEKEVIDGYVKNFNEIAKNKNELEAVKYLAQITGKPAHEFVDNMINTLLPEINRRQTLNEQELQLERQTADAKYQREQLELEKQSLYKQKADKDLYEKIESIKATKKLSADEWDETVRELDAKLPKSQEIYPETVSEYVDFKRGLRAERHLNIFNGGQLAQNAEVKAELVKVINDMPDLKDNEIQDLLSKAFTLKETQEVAAKLEKKVSNKKVNKQPNLFDDIQPLEHW